MGRRTYAATVGTALLFAALFAICACLGAGDSSQDEVAEKLATREVDFVGVMREGKVLVPMRQVFELLSAQVAWDGKTSTITATKADRVISLTLGARKTLVDGKEQLLEVAPRAEHGVTLVPLRFISESLGAHVSYDAAAREAQIACEQGSWRIRVPKPEPRASSPLSASAAARFFLTHAAEYGTPMPTSLRVDRLKSTGLTVRFGYRHTATVDGRPKAVPINAVLVLSRDRLQVAGYRVSFASGNFAGLALVTKLDPEGAVLEGD